MLKAIDPTGADLNPGQQAVMAGFASLLGGSLAGLAGANALGGATAAQNEVLNNTDDHPDTAAKNGGLLSQIGDAANAFIDRVKWTYSDPLGDISRWVSQFGGLVQSGAQQTMSQSPWSLAAQGVSNGLSAIFGVGGGLPPADPDLAPAGPGTGAGQFPSPVASPNSSSNTPSNALLSNGNGDGGSASGTGGDKAAQTAACPVEYSRASM